jgi:Ca2+-transporting ATPase
MSDWHNRNTAEALHLLETDGSAGLTTEEAGRRLSRYGPNELEERGRKSPWLILWEQFTAVMVVVLILAAAVSAILGDYSDSAAIMAIVLLNAALGFRQEFKAEKAVAALKKLAAPTVRVVRDGRIAESAAACLVPGDIIMIEAGNLVPADGRLLESFSLKTQEASLTGESAPVEKVAGIVLDVGKALAERRNLVFMGTTVTNGRGMAVVTDTGMNTELGRIADMLQAVKSEKSPLQQKLDKMGRALALAALAIVAVIFTLGLIRGEDIRLMFLTAVSLAVAAIPEGLPAVVTIALALGAQRMLTRHALIRKLPAVETLGSVTVICSDKTGTLTRNQMTVALLDVSNREEDLSGRTEKETQEGWSPAMKNDRPAAHPDIAFLLCGGALCNDAVLEPTNGSTAKSFNITGDPTEAAIVEAAARSGLLKPELEKIFPRIHEVPFDSDRKRMSTVHRFDEGDGKVPEPLADICNWSKGQYVIFTKGAVESLLDVADSVWIGRKRTPLDDGHLGKIRETQNRLAGEGMRILGVAFRMLSSDPRDLGDEALEKDLTFIGTIGMIDPPRPEAEAAVKKCRGAGIRPVMITGDHPLTALHIASRLGITDRGGVVTGKELDELQPDKLSMISEEVSIYARVSPEHKLNLVRALQGRGHIVAMTGDGVNDAPALKKADIGVAMGITGTDVAKEAADMVLLDDNFATIVAAVEEGRVIYDNIRKFVKYLLSCNSGELWVMLLAPLLGMPLPLLPIQILWMNLITDGLPALALGVEPPERNTMLRPPRNPSEGILNRRMGLDIVWIGLFAGFVSLAVGYFYREAGRNSWQTMIFTTLILSQMAIALSARSETESIFSMGITGNRKLLGAVFLTVCLQIVVMYVPFFQGVFRTMPISADDFAVSFFAGSLALWAVELEKLLIKWKTP